MKRLLFTVSGLRGVVGETLTPDVILKYTHAFVRSNGQGVYFIGRDTRPHGEMVKSAAVSAILATGSDAVDVGIVPTPTLLFMVREKEARGGIVVTASHNPMEWNALKLVKSGGVFTFREDVENIKKILDTGYEWANWDSVGKYSTYERAIEDHIDKIISSPYVDVDAIRQAGFRVAVDAVNGANFHALPRLLERLGIRDVIKLNCEPTGIFPHPPEPKKENLKELDEILMEGKADIGFATDPDGDRLLVGFKGMGLLTEEHTIVLAAPAVLSVRKTDIVVNLSTSMMIEDVAREFGVQVLRTPVGEANVVQKMQEIKSAFGGEGNGGVIVPEINATRDSLVGASLILTRVAKEGIERVLSGIKNYYLLKDRVEVRKEIPVEKMVGEFKPQWIDTSDGLYLRGGNFWVHVRPSNTEPIMRIYVESPERRFSEQLLERARAILLQS